MASLFLAACAGPMAPVKEAPRWVESRSHPAYPDALYLIGIGTSTNRDRAVAYREARDRAVADIASQLETRIESEVTTYVRESIRVEQGRQSHALLSHASSKVKAVAEATLSSIRPVAQHYNPKSGFASALIAIKRVDFARKAQQDLAAIDGKVRALLTEVGQLSKAGKLFQAVQLYTQIERMLVERSAVRAQASFVAPGLVAAKPAATLAGVFEKRRALAAQVKLLLYCKHDEFGQTGRTTKLEELLVSRFHELGIRVESGAKKLGGVSIDKLWSDPASLGKLFSNAPGSALLLLCEVSTSRRTVGHEGLISVRSRGSARLIDAKTGELLNTISYSPDTQGQGPAIGLARQSKELVDKALTQLAEYLAKHAFKDKSKRRP